MPPSSAAAFTQTGLMGPVQTPYAAQSPLPQGTSPFPIGKGISANGDMDPYTFLAQQQENNNLYNSSLNPQAPERSWTQGLARLLQSGVSGYNQAKLDQSMAGYRQNKVNDISKIGQFLSSGGSAQSPEFGRLVGSLADPSSQQLALQLAQAQMKNNFDLSKASFENNLGMQRDQAKSQSEAQTKAQYDPTVQAQNKLNQINDTLNGLQSAAYHEQDLNNKQALAGKIQQLTATRDQLSSQIKEGKGISPDPMAAAKEKAFESMSKGGKLEELPAEQAYALNPEAYQKGLAAGNTQADADIKAFRDAFKSSRELNNQGQQVAQMIAANPDLNSGPGAETFSKFRTVANNIFPGIDKNLASQQDFQTAVNNMITPALGRLKAEGVNMRALPVIENVGKPLVANMGDSKEGMKAIIELQDVTHKQLEKANDHLTEIESYARTHPFFDKNAAFQKLQGALDEDMQKASMTYANQNLNQQGKQMIINPQYDPDVGGMNKYVVVPFNQQPQAASTGASQPVPTQLAAQAAPEQTVQG